MEDIRPYANKEDERDDEIENPAEWEAARFETDEDVPFYLPRD